jgi:carbamoyl-phosphate synthase small subunit
MNKSAYLVLEDGSVYEGQAFGVQTTSHGEVVFNTSMTGYQEMITDPSYAGQIVIATYPLIGNYGINLENSESGQVQVAGFVVRELSDQFSHGYSTQHLQEFLTSHNVPGVSGVDTRSITRKLRTVGVMMGIISHESPESALDRLLKLPKYEDMDLVNQVGTKKQFDWDKSTSTNSGPLILVTDCGLKYNILRILRARNCKVVVVPSTSSASELLRMKPDGIVLSPGPGDPAILDYVTSQTKELLGRIPMMGICLGHQILARALGGNTFKLKFGHRGANHPVLDTRTRRVHITAQNHGYAVDADSLPSGIHISHLNLNDNTVEGLLDLKLSILTIQYHSEASPGPQDNEYLFDEFLTMVKNFR